MYFINFSKALTTHFFSIMVFRCASLVFPMKCRNIGHRPFLVLLGVFALFLGVTSALPFMPLSFVLKRYDYVQNLADCSYQINPNATGMVALTDVIWWGPFLTCITSCAIFVTVMAINAQNMQGAVSGYSHDVIKKTVLLTAFFIVCYFPKSMESLAFYLAGNGIWITWNDIRDKLGFPFVIYYHLVSGYVVPALRCAVTPLILKLKAYIDRCNTSKRHSHTDNKTIIESASIFVKAKMDSFKKESLKQKTSEEQKKDASELVQLV